MVWSCVANTDAHIMAKAGSVKVLHRATDGDDAHDSSNGPCSDEELLRQLQASNDSLKQRLEQVRPSACGHPASPDQHTIAPGCAMPGRSKHDVAMQVLAGPMFSWLVSTKRA